VGLKSQLTEVVVHFVDTEAAPAVVAHTAAVAAARTVAAAAVEEPLVQAFER